MTLCLARRSQASARALVVVIRSMNGPYAFENGVLPKALNCQGPCSEFEACNAGSAAPGGGYADCFCAVTPARGSQYRRAWPTGGRRDGNATTTRQRPSVAKPIN